MMNYKSSHYSTLFTLGKKPLKITLTLGKNPPTASKQLQLKAVSIYKAAELPNLNSDRNHSATDQAQGIH